MVFVAAHEGFVGGVAHVPTAEEIDSWFLHIQTAAIGINEFKTPLILLFLEFIIIILAYDVLEELVVGMCSVLLSRLVQSDSFELLVEDSILDQDFFGMEVFVESVSDYSIVVETHVILF